MKTVTLCIIGCGRIAEYAHFAALSGMECVRVKYACDLLPEKAESAVSRGFAEQAITDYRVALADPEVDAVYVLTPNRSHYEITMAALKAGKHVFCEKPVAVSYELSCDMAREARARGLILTVGVCNRFHRSVERLEKLRREGFFGDIYHVYCSFRSFRCIPGLGGAFTTKAESGGGVLIDWGIHFLDLIMYILGAPQLLSATADTYCGTAADMRAYRYETMWAEDTKNLSGICDVEDFVSGYVRTAGPSISLNGAWAQNLNREEKFIDFLGDRGGARLDYCGHFTLFGEEDGRLYERRDEGDIPDMYLLEDEEFIRSVRTDERGRADIESVLPSMKLLCGLYDSAKDRREIKF